MYRTEWPPAVGVYSKTAVRSPVVQWILHARLRNTQRNDAVLVGEDFVHIKEADDSGHLHHVATKADFDARICAAATFTNDQGKPTPSDFLNWSNDERATDDIPPQSIVLTLESAQLVFLHLQEDDNGRLHFQQRVSALPYLQGVRQLGRFLAVEPNSRAVAVAGPDGGVWILPTHQPHATGEPRMLRVEGVVQLMDFLIPPVNDHDNIILVLIVKIKSRNKIIRIEWQPSQGLQNTTAHPPLDVNMSLRSPSLLIPSRDASFLLITDDEILMCFNLLSGCLSQALVGVEDIEPTRPGASKRSPFYTGWARPCRSRSQRLRQDDIYLIREDGHLFYLAILNASDAIAMHAGDLGCQVDRAFASLGDQENDPDILIAAGAMNPGVIVSIGRFPHGSFPNVDRETALEPRLVQMLYNWAFVTDMVGSGVTQTRRHRTPDSENLLFTNSVFVTSGSQPYGSVTELRHGIEGHLEFLIEDEEMRMVNDIWALPNIDGSIILLQSGPMGTRVLVVDDLEESTPRLVESSFLDCENRTLSAGVSGSRQLVQVTDRAINVSTKLEPNFEDTLNKSFNNDTSILAATVISHPFCVITSEARQNSCSIKKYQLPSVDDSVAFALAATFRTDHQALCVAAIALGADILVLTATADADLIVLILRGDGTTIQIATRKIPCLGAETTLCDQLTILQPPDTDADSSKLLAVMGLRDGRIVTYEVDLASEEPVSGGNTMDFANTTSKLVRLDSNPASAIASSGKRIGLISWDGRSSDTTSMEDIWITDKARPEFSQGATLACAEFPSGDQLNKNLKHHAGTLILPSAKCLQLVKLGRSPSTVPRQIAVSGRPNRLVYAETLQCFVSSSLCYRPTLGPREEERRQVFFALDFIPRNSGRSTYTHEFQPGQRVNSLVEWSYKREDGKKYTQLIIGGSYTSKTGATKGQVTFLQATFDRETRDIVGITETKVKKFDREVWALALYDSITYIACVGDEICTYRLDTKGQDRAWKELCPPLRLSSPGRYVTVEHENARSIVITTAKDSLVVLQMDNPPAEDRSECWRLVEVSTGPEVQSGLSHFMLPETAIPEVDTDGLVLMTTINCSLIGLTQPTAIWPVEVVFEADLGVRSLTRIIAQPTRTRPQGVVSPKMLGCSADGSLTSLALICEPLRRRLFWLQRLCEWSAELSPFSQARPRYRSCSPDKYNYRDRAVPIGLVASDDWQGSEAVVHTSESKTRDMHIDGDVLSRVLKPGGVEAIKTVLAGLVQSGDAAGEWIKAHLEDELNAVEEVVGIVRTLDQWLAA